MANETMKQQLDLLLEAGTAVISDVLDDRGDIPVVLDNKLFAVKGRGSKFAGPAYTVTGEAHRWSGGDREKLAAIDNMPQGAVSVWAGMDIQGVCCFGDLLASSMQARGCAGAVVDGGIRDIAYLSTLKMPVVARYATPAQGIGRWKVTDHQIPIQVRGAIEPWVTVHPGDIVVADDDGVVVVSPVVLSEVVQRIEEWSKAETSARADVLAGMPLLKALEKYGHL